MKTKEAYRPSHAYELTQEEISSFRESRIMGPDHMPIYASDFIGSCGVAECGYCSQDVEVELGDFGVDLSEFARLLNEAYERGYRDGQTKGK